MNFNRVGRNTVQTGYSTLWNIGFRTYKDEARLRQVETRSDKLASTSLLRFGLGMPSSCTVAMILFFS
jgi:hypothetical protein